MTSRQLRVDRKIHLNCKVKAGNLDKIRVLGLANCLCVTFLLDLINEALIMEGDLL